MSEKTDADFIAEYEKFPLGAVATYQGVPVILSGGTDEMLSEAIERLKRANILMTRGSVKDVEEQQEQIIGLTAKIENYQRSFTVLSEQIAELKELLRWCRSEADFAHCDDTTIARIDELTREEQ